MIHSEAMQKFYVVGGRDLENRVVRRLYSLNLVHLASMQKHTDEHFREGRPRTFYEAEEILVRLRALIQFLGLTPGEPADKRSEFELLGIIPVQFEVIEEEVQAIRSRMEILEQKLDELCKKQETFVPLLGIQIPLFLLREYESIITKVISYPGTIPGLPGTMDVHPLSENRMLLLIPKEKKDAAAEALESIHFEEIPIPEVDFQGSPDSCFEILEREIADLGIQLREERKRLAELGEEHKGFLFEAEEVLHALSERNLAPLHFLDSTSTFSIAFWVPCKRQQDIFDALREEFGEAIEILTQEEETFALSEEEDEEPAPTCMKNPRLFAPFEFLTEMYSTPLWKEIDPTFLLALFFPLYFGIMVGDAGYGILILLLGLLMRKAAGKEKGMASLGSCLAWGGGWAFFIGTFLFAEAFGIHFHHHGEEGHTVFAWASVLPFLPHALLQKLPTADVVQALLLSVFLGWIHMSLGLIIGIVNNWKHHFSHAVAKGGWLLVLAGLALLIMSLQVFYDSPLGGVLWNIPLLPASFLGIDASIIGSLIAGLVLVIAGEGPLGLAEVFGPLCNLISFTRIAIIGISKAAMVTALNASILPLLSKDPSVLTILIAALTLFLGHGLILGLGVLTASIQSLRLNYFEVFSKFYHGDGLTYQPFGLKRKYTTT